jgi:hypothetical protein
MPSKSGFKPFNWFNFEYFPDSEANKFELYSTGDVNVTNSNLIFQALFGNFYSELEIGQPTPNANWGDFCIDVWDVKHDKYDYSLEGKNEATIKYLSMLKENDIAPEYTGLCHCLMWDEFLPVALECVITHIAPYSLMFYCPNYEFVFYFHHSGSFGVYYRTCNKAILDILGNAKGHNLRLKNYTEEEVESIFQK